MKVTDLSFKLDLLHSSHQGGNAFKGTFSLLSSKSSEAFQGVVSVLNYQHRCGGIQHGVGC